MNQVLELLQKNARYTNRELAELLDMEEDDVARRIRKLEEEGAIIGYTTLLDQERYAPDNVTASIEVRITPEREGGFNRIANRIAQYPQVKSCYLMSGGYDLLVVVQGQDLREVARFVAEKLSSIAGVLSTATHFQLKTYKEHGLMCSREVSPERLPVTP